MTLSRIVCFLIPTAMTAQTSTKPEILCWVEGRIVSSVNGQPVRKASVLLIPPDAPLETRVFSAGQVFGTSSDGEGKFAMSGIEPGKYRLRVVRNGFVVTEYGARSPGKMGTQISLAVSLGEVQHLKDVNISLPPQAVITGHVFDENGESARGYRVDINQVRYSPQGKRQLEIISSTHADDTGAYRIPGLAPGSYYLWALRPSLSSFDLAIDKSAHPKPSGELVTSFYPGVTSIAAASMLDVPLESQLSGIDIKLVRAPLVHIRGHVTLSGNAGMARITTYLFPNSAVHLTNQDRNGDVTPQGNFDIPSVAAGSYFLQVTAVQGNKRFSTRIPVEVGRDDVEGLNLQVGPGVDLTGRFEPREGADLSGVRLSLTPRDYGFRAVSTPNAKITADGAFMLPSLNSDMYAVDVAGLPEGAYLKSIRSGDVDVLASGLDVGLSAPAPLIVTLGRNAGEVSGTVENATPGTTVALAPQDADRRSWLFYKSVTLRESANFDFRNVAPGKYKLFAWDDVEPNAWMDPEFVKPWAAKAIEVTVREGTRLTLQPLPPIR